jgi:ABC-2 type transport system ATP-binding protein
MDTDSSTSASDAAVMMKDAGLDFGGAGVFDLNLTLPKGAILGMIGPSGCGKTTTIRLINGVYGPTAGTVRVFGKDPARFAEGDKARMGYIPQHFVLYPTLSVEENMQFLGRIYGMSSAERKAKIGPLLEFVELAGARKRRASKLSGGMQRRLMLAGALLHDPDLLIADEPTAGIDPILRARIWENFRELRDEGKTLLVTTQVVSEAAYCDRDAVMRNGRLITVDTPRGLQRQALGGEAIHLQVEEGRLGECIRFLNELPQVTTVERIAGEPNGIHVFVEDAAGELPALLGLLREKLGLTPKVAEPYVPPFDEIFVRLIHAAEARENAEVPLS